MSEERPQRPPRPPGKEELAPVSEEERFRRLEELQEQVPDQVPGQVSEPED